MLSSEIVITFPICIYLYLITGYYISHSCRKHIKQVIFLNCNGSCCVELQVLSCVVNDIVLYLMILFARDLSYNPGLIGPIPPEIGKLTTLTSL